MRSTICIVDEADKLALEKKLVFSSVAYAGLRYESTFFGELSPRLNVSKKRWPNLASPSLSGGARVPFTAQCEILTLFNWGSKLFEVAVHVNCTYILSRQVYVSLENLVRGLGLTAPALKLTSNRTLQHLKFLEERCRR